MNTSVWVAGKSWNNQQNIFHRWLPGYTATPRDKIRQLLPAILGVLPREYRHRLSIYDTLERRALLAAQDALGVTIEAHDDAIEAVYSSGAWGRANLFLNRYSFFNNHFTTDNCIKQITGEVGNDWLDEYCGYKYHSDSCSHCGINGQRLGLMISRWGNELKRRVGVFCYEGENLFNRQESGAINLRYT